MAEQSYTNDHPIASLTRPTATGAASYALNPSASLTAAGLAFDATNRVVSGTWTAAVTGESATTTFSYTATNIAASTTLPVAITVFPSPTLTLPAVTSLTFTAGFPLASLPTPLTIPGATGGRPPLSFSLAVDQNFSAGAAPPGVDLHPGTRLLTGTPREPTGGTTTNIIFMTYVATDANGARAASVGGGLSVELNSSIEFGTNVMDVMATEGEPITALTLPAATGGTGTLSVTLTPDVATDTAFAGLTFMNRVLTGALTGNGGALVWKATDATGAFTALTFRVTTSGPFFAAADAVAAQT